MDLSPEHYTDEAEWIDPREAFPEDEPSNEDLIFDAPRADAPRCPYLSDADFLRGIDLSYRDFPF